MNYSKGTKVKAVLLVAFVVALVLRLFFVEGFVVRGDSMAPTILSGDYIFINKLAYRGDREPKRGDVVITKTRGEGLRVVKRVVVLPGERFSVRDGQVVLHTDRDDEGESIPLPDTNGAVEWESGLNHRKLDPQEYFALGDNVAVSLDSRALGFVDRWSIKGRVFGILRFKGFKYISI